MSINGRIFLVAAVYLMALTHPAFAAEEKHGKSNTYHHYHQHTLEFFLGDTFEDGEHGNLHGFTIGLFYEYRFTEQLGTGGFIEYAGENINAWTAGVPLFFHPYKGIRFVLAPGFEQKHGEKAFISALSGPCTGSWLIMKK